MSLTCSCTGSFNFLFTISNFPLFFYFCYSATRDLEEKRSHFDGLSQVDDTEGPSKFDEHDFVPHFQRVNISGEDTSGVCAP